MLSGPRALGVARTQACAVCTFSVYNHGCWAGNRISKSCFLYISSKWKARLPTLDEAKLALSGEDNDATRHSLQPSGVSDKGSQHLLGEVELSRVYSHRQVPEQLAGLTEGSAWWSGSAVTAAGSPPAQPQALCGLQQQEDEFDLAHHPL